MLSDEEVGDEKIETFEPLISGDFSPGGNADSASNPVLGSSLQAQRCTQTQMQFPIKRVDRLLPSDPNISSELTKHRKNCECCPVSQSIVKFG